MICTTLQDKNLEDLLNLLESEPIQMAEIRLDRCPLSEEDIEVLFSSSDTPLVATCRVAGDGNGTWSEAEAKLLAAIKAGAAFADLEMEAPPSVGKKVRRACSDCGTAMIRSCHFFDGTPPLDVLLAMALKCSGFGGEIVKIVTYASSKEDADTVLSLYDSDFQGRLIAFAMGAEGGGSRVECLKKGAPFTYAALSEEEAAAPGQWDFRKMASAVYGDYKFIGCEKPLTMPSSKSFAQRVIVASALSEGKSRLEGYSSCGDNESAVEAARALGADVRVEGSEVIVNGIGAKASSRGQSLAPKNQRMAEHPETEAAAGAGINVGESGLLTRLMIPIVAAINPGTVEIEGRGSLLDRPLKGASEIMASFGTVLRPIVNASAQKDDEKNQEGTAKGRSSGLHVPLLVQGPLLAGNTDISGKDGSQLISGLLMALPLLERDSMIFVRNPKSIPYMFITIDVLRRFGITIGSEMEGDDDFAETQDWGCCTGIRFQIKGRQKYSCAAFEIEGDWSAAAVFLVAGSVFGKILLAGMDTTSLQADISIMDILMEAGASLSQIEEEDHRGLISAQMAPLRSFDTDLNNCPDLFPIVAVLAAFCGGRSNVQGFKRLASKESDRGTAILNMLAQMGVPAFSEGDTLTIEGMSLAARVLCGKMLKGGDYTSSHDHRMAMALSVASLGADTPILIDDTACVAKSFPRFFDVFNPASKPVGTTQHPSKGLRELLQP